MTNPTTSTSPPESVPLDSSADDVTASDIPPTSLGDKGGATATAAPPKKKKGSRKKRATARAIEDHVPGDELLVPDIENATFSVESLVFWVGVHPDAPFDALPIGGQTFLKSSARMVLDPRNPVPGTKTPHMQVGNLARVTREDLDLIKSKLRRTYVKVFKRGPAAQAPVAGAELAADSQARILRGKLVTRKTQEELDACEAAGRSPRDYKPQPGDRSAAEFVWMVPCERQDDPRCGVHMPPMLSETGLRWPEDLPQE